MYQIDPKGGNQPQTWRPHSLAPRNAISLPMAGNDPRELLGAIAPRRKGAAMVRAAGSCCSSCASGGSCSGGHNHAAGLGDFTIGSFDLSTLGWTGYAALGVGLWLMSKVLFTGDRAKQRRSALKKAEADYRLKRDEIAKQYPRI